MKSPQNNAFVKIAHFSFFEMRLGPIRQNRADCSKPFFRGFYEEDMG
jgi:hypothetical protein